VPVQTRLCLSPLLLLLAWTVVEAPFGFAQGRQTPVFRGGVETVEVTVTVTDANGRLITGLAREDFSVYEDGELQAVTHFTDDRVPVSLGIVLDVSDSMVGRPIVDAREALDLFVGDLLKPEDEAFVSVFNHRPGLVAPWTRPPALLTGKLADVRPNGATAIYDALAAAVPIFTSRTHARAAIVLISDGADTASDLTLIQTRGVLQHSDPFVYAIAIDSSTERRESAHVNPEALRNITAPSGGYTEVVHSAADLRPATERIAYELNHQYTLGYTASRPPDGSWRNIRVRLRSREHFARARRGYFAVPLSER
jgi:Ca-activated chloride channel family protein